ncbi:MAG: cytochrome c [Candidatus Sulfotelmatobacter sp.]
MRNFLLGVLATLVALAAGTFAYLKLGLAEARGDLHPSRLESYLMSTAVHASVRREAPEVPNPVQPTDENLIAGGKMYLNGCAGCHGTPGKEQDYGDVLYPPIPQLPKVGTEYSEAQIFWVAKHGIRRTRMFANGKWSSDEHLWTVAAYIKRMNALPELVKEALEPKKAAAPDSKDSSKQQ